MGLLVLLQSNLDKLGENELGDEADDADTKRFKQRYQFLFSGYSVEPYRWYEPKLEGRSTAMKHIIARSAARAL